MQALALLARLHAEELRAETRAAGRVDKSAPEPAEQSAPTPAARPRGMAVLALPPIEGEHEQHEQPGEVGPTLLLAAR